MQIPSHTITGALAGMHRHFRVSNAKEIPHGNYFSYALTQCQEASYYIKNTGYNWGRVPLLSVSWAFIISRHSFHEDLSEYRRTRWANTSVTWLTYKAFSKSPLLGSSQMYVAKTLHTLNRLRNPTTSRESPERSLFRGHYKSGRKGKIILLVQKLNHLSLFK